MCKINDSQLFKKCNRSIVGAFPLIVGGGMMADTVADQLAFSDGGIVGSYFKYGGDAYGYMDENRVKSFMTAAAG